MWCLILATQGVQTSKSRIISDVVLAITFLITFIAMWYILREMNKVKPQVIYARRKARQGKQARAGYPPYGGELGSTSTIIFNPNVSDANIPLTAAMQGDGQERWGQHGNATEYAGNPNIVAPKPQRLSSLTGGYELNTTRVPRDVEEGKAYQRAPRESTSDEVGWDMGHNRVISDPYSETMDEDMTMLSSARPLKVAEYLTSSPPPADYHITYDAPSTNSYAQLPLGAAHGAFQMPAHPLSPGPSAADARLQGLRAFSPPPPTLDRRSS